MAKLRALAVSGTCQWRGNLRVSFPMVRVKHIIDPVRTVLVPWGLTVVALCSAWHTLASARREKTLRGAAT